MRKVKKKHIAISVLKLTHKNNNAEDKWDDDGCEDIDEVAHKGGVVVAVVLILIECR